MDIDENILAQDLKECLFNMVSSIVGAVIYFSWSVYGLQATYSADANTNIIIGMVIMLVGNSALPSIALMNIRKYRTRKAELNIIKSHN